MNSRTPIDAKGKGAKKKKHPVASSTTSRETMQNERLGRTITSFDVFELCIQRARNLIKLHKAAHGKAGKPEKYTADAHRAAIVLSVSALDAFVRDFAISRTIALIANRKEALPEPLSAQIRKYLDDKSLLEAARRDDLLERVEKALQNDFEKRSFQGTKNIEGQFKLLGYESVFHDVAVSANMNEETLRNSLDRFTRRRHAIAHRGDYDLSKNPPEEMVIVKRDAEDCVRLVCKIAKHIHSLGEK